MAEGDAGNLKIQQEINKVLSARTALLASNQKALSGQVATAIQLCKALKCEELDKIAEQMGAIDNATLKAAKAAKEYGNKAAKASAAAVAATKAEEEALKKRNAQINVAKAAAVGAFGGMMSGIAGSLNMLKSLGKGLMGIVGTVGKLGKSILMLPFKIMGGLIGMAQSGGGGGPSPIRLELEAIRKEYGSLASNEGKTLASVQGQINAASKNLGGTGLALAKVFGRGKKGVAEAMKQAGEIAKSLGPAFNGLQEEFKKNAVELTMLTRGFTGSSDATAAMLRHAKALGKDGTKYITEIAGMAQTMGKQFGISAKVIGKGMGEMMKNISDFGHMAKKEMLAAATYAGKLGLEIKDLAGVMNKFLNFEDAAEGAAQMAQAFGMNVDAMELMKGGPEAIDEMRRAFFESGKSLEDMSAAERKLLEQQTGLTGAAMESAFAAESQGTSYKDMKKGADTAEDQAKSQTEVMNKLADSIDRVFGGGGGGKKFKSFFDAFTQGFGDGIKKTKEFRGLMKNLRKSLKVVYKGGKDIGKMFVKMFPGVQDLIKGTTKLFDPKRIKALMNDVKKVFKSFFKDLETNPETAVNKFFERMTKAFKKWFSSSGPAAGQMKKGAGTFLKALGAIFKGLLTMALKGLTKLFNGLADAIRNPPEVKSAFGQALVEFGKSIVEIFKALGPPLWEAMKNLFSAIWEKLKGSEVIGKAMKILKKILLTRIFLAAAFGAAKAAAGAVLVNVIGPWMKKMVMGADKIPKTKDTGPADPNAIKKITEAGGGIEGDKTNWKKAMAKGALIVLFIAVTIVALAGAFWVAAQIIKTISMEDIIKTGVVMLTMGATMVLIGIAAKLTEGADIPAMQKTLGLMLLIIPALGLVGIALGFLISNTPMPDVGTIVAWGIMMAAAMVSAGGAIFSAGMAAKIIDAFGAMTLIKGLLILGAVILVLGGIAVAIGWMISTVPNPGNVSKVMMGLAAIMGVTLLMLPAAFALGVMLLTPFGGLGIVALLAGFGVMGLLAGVMIGSLMPAIQTIAGIKLENPAEFKMITEAIVAIIKGVAAFASAVANILEALDPGIAASISGDASSQLQESIKSVNTLISAIMAPITNIIELMIDLATTAGIESTAVEAIKAISAVIGAIAALMKSFSPSDAAFKAAEEAQGFFNPNGASNLMKTVNDGLEQTIKAAVPMIKQIGALITDIAAAIDGADFSKVGPLMQAMPGILSAIAQLMNAMKPTDGEMAAVAEAADTYGGDEVGLMKQINERMVMGIEAMKPLIKTISTEFQNLIKQALMPMIDQISKLDVDPKILEAVGKIIGSIMGAFGKMMEAVGPIMETFQKAIPRYQPIFSPSAGSQMTTMMSGFKTMMEGLTESFTAMLPKITAFIKAVVKLADGFADPDKTMKGMEVIAKAVGLLGDIIDPMFKAWKAVYEFGKGRATSWQQDIDFMFGDPNGFLFQLVAGVGGAIGKLINDHLNNVKIADPEGMTAKLEVITKAMDVLGKMVDPMMKAWDAVYKFGKGRGTSWQEDIEFMFGDPNGFIFQMVTGIGGAIGIMMTKLTASVKDVDPVVMSAKFDVVLKGVQASGEMLKLMTDAWAIVKKYGTGKATSWSEDIDFFFHPTTGLVTRMADGLASGLSVITKKIIESVAGIPNPEFAAKQIDVVAKILEAVSTFTEVIATVGKLRPPGKGADKSVRGIMKMMAGLSAQLAQDMPLVIKGVMGAIEGAGGGMSKLWKYRHSIGILGKLMCAVGAFVEAVSTVRGLGTSQGNANFILKSFSELFGPGGWGRLGMTNLIDAISQMGLNKVPSGAAKAMENIAKFLESYGKAAKAITDLKVDKSFYKKGDLLVEGLGDTAIGEKSKKGTGPLEQIRAMANIIGHKTKGFKTQGRIDTKGIKQMATFLTDGYVPAVNAINSVPDSISAKVGTVAASMEQLNAMAKGLSGKKFATAVKIGENLSKSNGKVTLTHENVNINLTVQVDMSAEQVARGLVKTKEMKTAMGQGG